MTYYLLCLIPIICLEIGFLSHLGPLWLLASGLILSAAGDGLQGFLAIEAIFLLPTKDDP